MSGPFYAPGRYIGVVTGQGISMTNTGKHQFVLKVNVTGYQNGEPVEQQYERTIYRVLTDKTIEYFMDDLKTLGFTGESFRFLDPGTSGYQDFTGREVPLNCEHDTYQGKTSEKWSLARAGTSKPIEPADSASLRQLDNLFGKQLKTLKQTSAASRPAPRAQATSAPPPQDFGGIDDNDVPF